MGKVAVTMKLFLEDQKKMEETLKNLGKIVEIKNHRIEDVGFGITALKILFVMEDSGGIDAIEEKIGAIPNISQAQTEDVTLL